MTNAEETADFYKKAIESFDAALKSGVKIQAESAQLINDALKNVTAPQAWQEKGMASVKEALALGTKNMDSAASLINKNAQNSMDLLKRAFASGQGCSAEEIQGKTSELWSSALNALKENTQAVMDINARTVETLTKLAKTGTEKAQ